MHDDGAGGAGLFLMSERRHRAHLALLSFCSCVSGVFLGLALLRSPKYLTILRPDVMEMPQSLESVEMWTRGLS